MRRVTNSSGYLRAGDDVHGFALAGTSDITTTASSAGGQAVFARREGKSSGGQKGLYEESSREHHVEGVENRTRE